MKLVRIHIRDFRSLRDLPLEFHDELGLFRNQIPLQDFHYFTTAGGADVESASTGAIAAAVHSFLHPDISEPTRLSAQLIGHRKKPSGKRNAWRRAHSSRRCRRRRSAAACRRTQRLR